MKQSEYKWEEPSTLNLLIKGFTILILLSVIAFIIFFNILYPSSKYITIETPKDWDEYNPNTCSKAEKLLCIDYVIFIEDLKEYESAQDKIESPDMYRIYYLKNNSPNLKRYIENNWSNPSRYPHVNVLFKKKGAQWDQV